MPVVRYPYASVIRLIPAVGDRGWVDITHAINGVAGSTPVPSAMSLWCTTSRLSIVNRPNASGVGQTEQAAPTGQRNELFA